MLQEYLTIAQIMTRKYSLPELKNICRKYHIHGFANTRKNEIALMISKTFYEEPDEMLDILLEDDEAVALLSLFFVHEHNAVSLKGPVPSAIDDAFMVNYNKKKHMISVPQDIYFILSKYFKKHHIDIKS
ncbi:hypothetical protein K2V61_12155 [Staphylococcus simulans]|uniref:hypothetical protein n=1 Tax=Staphylococcus simulans TaxID=1286 RepID=UPI001E541192|nr:hypothetical protein [Staphylococcus simulans]MCD8916292.1 hypothetical protein [Staphylococcus simulans]